MALGRFKNASLVPVALTVIKKGLAHSQVFAQQAISATLLCLLTRLRALQKPLLPLDSVLKVLTVLKGPQYLLNALQELILTRLP
jgi:hypothetical protein